MSVIGCVRRVWLVIALALLVGATSAAGAVECEALFEPPQPHPNICESYFITGDDQARNDRDAFVSWLFQQFAYGNMSTIQQVLFPPQVDASLPEALSPPKPQESFLWLVGKEHSMAISLWCTFESLAENDTERDEKLYAGVIKGRGDRAAPLARFWLGYDLTIYYAQEMLTLIEQDLAERGVIRPLATGDSRLEPFLSAAQCSVAPFLDAAFDRVKDLKLPDAHLDLIADARDAARLLTDAVQAEITGAAERRRDTPNLSEAVNDQLHDEVDGGLINSRVLVDVKLLAHAFDALRKDITDYAQHINALNADMMAADRNMTTYTQVFADDFKSEVLTNRFNGALDNLTSVLVERDLINEDEDRKPIWDDQGDVFLLNDENKIVRACRDDKNCAYCQINAPLSRENLEQYLICFHAVGLSEARDARQSVLQPDSLLALEGGGATWEACLSKQMSALDAELDDYAAERKEAVTTCFLNWVWDVDPMIAAQLEASFDD